MIALKKGSHSPVVIVIFSFADQTGGLGRVALFGHAVFAVFNKQDDRVRRRLTEPQQLQPSFSV